MVLTYRLDQVDAFHGVFKLPGSGSKAGVLIVFGPQVQRLVMHLLGKNIDVEGAHL